jgi:hypothetical protein
MPSCHSPRTSTHRLHQLRARQRDLEAQVHIDFAAGGVDGAEEIDDEALERNRKASLVVRAMREEQWRKARAMEGRPVKKDQGSGKAEVLEEGAGSKEGDGLRVVVVGREKVLEKPGLVKVRDDEVFRRWAMKR